MRQGRFGGRRRRPHLLGVAARTAVIAGTATAVTGAIRRRHHNHNHAEPEPAAAPEAGDDRLDRLERLGELRKSGVLSDAEFDAEKAEILGRPKEPEPS